MTPNSLPGRAPAAGPGGAEGGHPQPPSAAQTEGVAVHAAVNLLYEVAAWLSDVDRWRAEPEEMHDALIDRLIPVADAALAEFRAVRDAR